MQLVVPANWQKDYFEKIDLTCVAEVYGKLREDCLGGGRSSLSSPFVSKTDFRQFVRDLRKRDIDFNYLLNATCLGNLELTRHGYRAIRRLLDWLSDSRVSAVTVSMPFVLQIVKKHYPDLKITVSTQARVDCLERVRYWENIGADRITLSYVDLNRDFTELRRITQNTSIELQLIANLICRRRCPFIGLHGNFSSHASRPKRYEKGLPLDYYIALCSERIFSDPESIIRSCWIRPEDMHHYESMGNINLKLVERGMCTDALATVVTAYTTRKYDGNFIDLIPTPSKLMYVAGGGNWKLLREFLKPLKVNVFRLLHIYRRFNNLQKQRDYHQELDIFIDNKKLDGIIERMMEHDCTDTVCERCGFCTEKARELVTVSESSKDNTSVLGSFVDSLVDGDLFRYR